MKPSTPAPGDLETRYRDPLLLLTLASVAAIVRWIGLSDWWLNPDEGIYYSILTRADFAGFWAEVTANAHPPLYYLILRGLGALTWDFYWLRVFSVLCGVAAVAAVWGATREAAGRGRPGAIAGFTAGLIVAIGPGPIELSQVMRPYMFQLALLATALYALLRYRDTDGIRALALYAIVISAALLTHYSSMLALGAIGLYVLWDGIDRGVRERHWLRLAAAQLAPAAVVAGLYLIHIRPLAGSALADDALDGWLSFYMIDSVSSAWLAFLGFQHLLADTWMRGPMALLLVAGVVTALLRGPRSVGVFAVGALAMGVFAASIGAYPFGSTRHSMWLVAFVVPPIGLLTATLIEAPVRIRTGGLAALAALLAIGGPLGELLREPSAPWAPSDLVLRQENLSQIVDALDPADGPPLLVMSAQTFYLLLPFYALERESASFSADSTAFHFEYGDRRVLASSAWDFSTRAGVSGTVELRDFLDEAERAFPDIGLDRELEATIVVGGWRPPFVSELSALADANGFLRAGGYVPGLFAFVVDVRSLRSALARSDAGEVFPDP